MIMFFEIRCYKCCIFEIRCYKCDRIDVSKGTDPAKSNKIKEYMICHYWSFNLGFKFQDFACNGCHDLKRLCLNISDIAIITVKYDDYRCIIDIISKSATINLLERDVCENRWYI